MKVTLSEGKMILRFTLNFILHQILMFLLMSVPSVFYLYIFKQNPEEPTYYTLIAVSTLALYFVYCLFYGYYVALPMADIILRIQRLAKGNYEALPKRRFSNPANHLYREVYRNLAALTETLQQEEKRRKEFEKQRQEWAAGVTHDLKTPLSYITGYTDMLLSKQHPWTEEEKEEFLCIMKEKAKYMEELINDLGLAFQMEQSPMALQGMEKIELAEFMRRILAEAASMPKAREDDLEIQVSDSPIYIQGNRKLLHRAFSNLLVNSIVHNPPGTKITVQLAEGQMAEIQIADNGSGMDEEDTKHLFDRYHRGTSTDAHVGGTGLGMAIVKQIITAQGGSVQVESEPGKGTVFLVRLPHCLQSA